jgi:hypothetical protein
MGQLVKAAAE